MISFYLFSLLFLKTINHDCFCETKSSIIHSNEVFDYRISCSNRITQKIDLKNIKQAKSVSIYNTTKVIFKCSNNDGKISMNIFDNPSVIFENDCIFDTISIYNSPIIDLMQKNITAGKVIFHNHSNNNYTFNSKNYMYPKDKQINLTEIIDCNEELIIDMSDLSVITCGKRKWVLEKEADFKNYVINSYNNEIYFTGKYINLYINDIMTYLIDSLHFYGNVYLFFDNVNDYLAALWAKQLKDKFDDIELQVYLYRWKWLDETNIKTPEWRYFNAEGTSIFDSRYNYYYYIEPIGDLIIIPTKASLIIIISIIALILLIIISTYIIGYFCHKKSKE